MTSPQDARRMFDLVEPIGVLPYRVAEPNDRLEALGCRTYWDGYFAGRAAPLGADVPAEVVHAIFYNFGPGEAARHLPRVWQFLTPEQALTAVREGSVAALHRILGPAADDPGIERAGELLLRAATHDRTDGRPLYAAVRSLPVPDEPVARFWHAATLLREYRGDGHNSVLLAEGVSGTEAHVLLAVDFGMRPREFGRIHHLPAPYLDAVIGGLHERGVLDADDRFTAAGRALKDRIEERTDALAAPAYAALTRAEFDELAAALEPIAAAINASFD